jgi:hypothetical protein
MSLMEKLDRAEMYSSFVMFFVIHAELADVFFFDARRTIFVHCDHRHPKIGTGGTDEIRRRVPLILSGWSDRRYHIQSTSKVLRSRDKNKEEKPRFSNRENKGMWTFDYCPCVRVDLFIHAPEIGLTQFTGKEKGE